MQAYTAITTMLDCADSFGEQRVILDVAERAGVMWTCVNERCGRENINESAACEECGTPAPEPGLRPGEWACPACRFTNWLPDRTCGLCHHRKPSF